MHWRARPKTLREWWLLTRVATLLLAFRLFLLRVPLPTTLRWLTPVRVPATADAGMMAKATQYADALLWRLAFPLRGPCLPRSLTLYYFARRYGFPVQFHCGVCRTNGTLQGHAWLSLSGRPFLEANNPADNYAVTFSFPDYPSSSAPADFSLPPM